MGISKELGMDSIEFVIQEKIRHKAALKIQLFKLMKCASWPDLIIVIILFDYLKARGNNLNNISIALYLYYSIYLTGSSSNSSAAVKCDIQFEMFSYTGF
jgi:hypothetical protein